MPYGLFNFEDMIQPMGLSPQAPDFVPAQKIPATTPPNVGLVTKAVPESLGFGFGDDMLEVPQRVSTLTIPEHPPQQMTQATFENNPIVTDGFIGSEAPPITLRMPENPVTPTPTPPSGQCPAGYQSSNQSSSAPVKPPSAGYQFYDAR